MNQETPSDAAAWERAARAYAVRPCCPAHERNPLSILACDGAYRDSARDVLAEEWAESRRQQSACRGVDEMDEARHKAEADMLEHIATRLGIALPKVSP